MKYLLVVLIGLGISTQAYSQNLSFDQVLSLRKNNLAEVEEYLSTHGWSFLEGSAATDTTLATATFTYKRSTYEDKAESFLLFVNSSDNSSNRLRIQVVKKDIYELYLARIKALGCKLIKSEIVDGGIVKVYQGATTTIKISILTDKDEEYSTKTIYNFFIAGNFDYAINFSDEE
ncbi:MAG: hypothetical protein K9I84_03520 [Leadbetterella sp.]|nr:hypothetical protein [Leadbetterella sp.]